jgi:NAD(P)-dependent dehydrogenase (short-subunit alcohol dehydrogenase family)
MSIHNFEMNKKTPSYGLSKNAAALTMQLLAREVPASDMQIVSFHPGFIYTFSARELGFTDRSLFDHGKQQQSKPSFRVDIRCLKLIMLHCYRL